MPDTPETQAEVEAVLQDGPLDALRWLPIGLSLDPPDAIDVQSVCLSLADHPDDWVRGNAIVALGHLARVTGDLDRARVTPVIRAALRDHHQRVRGQAGDAESDIRHFMGWKHWRVR
ncbi:hypothetical protein [Brevundimonas sp. FT23042]|uniref:hypothetical protein n=1 Tax=Brevundimonas sp. FT23042 TaxID=3393749 RepID=UPI003B58A17F